MKLFLSFLVALLTMAASSLAQKPVPAPLVKYVPDDQKLYDSIVLMDSIFFAAYNSCDVHLKEYASFFADSIEFYHDKGGLMTSKEEMISATKRNVCGKVSRELVNGSIEVYPIKNFGAIEIGYHKFHNHTEPENTPAHPGRFVIVWQRKNDQWKITRVISLH